MATFGICSSAPPTPPSSSADTKTQPFLIGLKLVRLKFKKFNLLVDRDFHKTKEARNIFLKQCLKKKKKEAVTSV